MVRFLLKECIFLAGIEKLAKYNEVLPCFKGKKKYEITKMRAEKIYDNTNKYNRVKPINPLPAALVGGIVGYALKYAIPLSKYEKRVAIGDSVKFSTSSLKDKSLLKALSKNSRPGFYFAAIGAVIASAIVCLGNGLIASGTRNKQ